MRSKPGIPERRRWLHLARSGSQSQRRIQFILPALGASHIIKLVSKLDSCIIFHTFPLHIAFLDNFPPKIVTDSNVINATLYEAIELKITAVDNDTITFRVINKPAGAIVSQSGNVLYFKWTVTSPQKVGYRLLSVVNVDDNYH